MPAPAGQATSALVAGATGLVGSRLIPELLRGGTYAAVHSIQRKRVDVPGVVTHVCDLSAMGELELGTTVRDAFCCLGTTIRAAGSRNAFRRVDLEYVRDFATVAHRHGARHFLLVSSVGAGKRASTFYLRTKGEAEAALAKIGFDHISVFRPSLLLGHRQEPRPGERVAQAVAPLVNPLMFGPMRRYRGIDATTVARAMVAVAASKARLPTATRDVFESEHLERLAEEASPA